MKLLSEVSPGLHLYINNNVIGFQAVTPEAIAEYQENSNMYQDVLIQLGKIAKSQIKLSNLRLKNHKMINEIDKEGQNE